MSVALDGKTPATGARSRSVSQHPPRAMRRNVRRAHEEQETQLGTARARQQHDVARVPLSMVANNRQFDKV